ncbi:pentatricopeptide repeat-containing protein At2g15690, mitochondrial-like, partial [Bidens hawaiensis]|uniref:pentatricopeptide repeat-containing protein At2g15690, mitochondrial-like n=1 Tax=Bidens hawaiensis TaxID=980011 RepID=UPI00404ACF9D
MASLMAIRRATSSSCKVRSLHSSIFTRNSLKSFSTSAASNNNQWNPQPNWNNNPNQGYPVRQNYPPNVPNQNPNQSPNFYSQNQYQNPNPNYRQTQNYPPPPPPPPSPQSPSPSVKKVDLLSVCKEGKLKEAIELLGQGELADAECFHVLFGLCGKLKKLEEAKKVHDYFLRSSYRGDVQLNHKVIDMYSKCGSMVDARRVFDHMSERNMDSWHCIINGYAGNGLGDDGLEMYEQMRNVGLQPNEETFLAVLDSCAGADAIEEAF